MRDFQFISVSDAIQIVSTTEVEGSSTRTLKITAKGGVGYANRVYINGFGIDSFTILSRTSLVVTLPTSLEDVEITDMDISVSSSRLTSTRTPSTLSFGPSREIRSIEGIQKLIQQVIKTLLSDIGSNRFSTAAGGNLLATLKGTNLDSSSSAKISSLLQASVASTLSTVSAGQTGQRLPADEKLLTLELTAVVFDPAGTEVTAGITLTTYAGNSFSIPLAL